MKRIQCVLMGLALAIIAASVISHSLRLDRVEDQINNDRVIEVTDIDDNGEDLP